MDKDNLVELLPTFKIFNGLSLAQLSNLIDAGVETRFLKNDFLIKNAESSREIYVILEGHLEVKSGNAVVAKIEKQEVVGEMGVFTGEPRSADVVALTDMKTLKISRDRIYELIHQDSDLGLILYQNVVNILSRHLRGNNLIMEFSNILDHNDLG